MNDNTKVIVALLVGIAAGAGLGILFAPDAGDETRGKINDTIKNLAESVKETATAEIQSLVQLKDRVVENLKTRISGAEPEYQDDLEHA